MRSFDAIFVILVGESIVNENVGDWDDSRCLELVAQFVRYLIFLA